jgi:hypothetical protein
LMRGRRESKVRNLQLLINIKIICLIGKVEIIGIPIICP